MTTITLSVVVQSQAHEQRHRGLTLGIKKLHISDRIDMDAQHFNFAPKFP